MKQISPASRTERNILLLLASTLLVCLLVAIGFEIAEELRLRDFGTRFPNVSFDAPRQSLAGLNLLTIPLFFSVVLARRYAFSAVLTVLYLAMLSFGIYIRLNGRGYFGGEGFYQYSFSEIFAKIHWFEILVPVMLIVILLIHVRIHLRSRIHSQNKGNLP